MDENLVWSIRTFIYQHFVDTTRPPRAEEAAYHFGITPEQAAEVYEELGRRHALYLAPGTHNVQMAWPFSGLETSFKVFANGMTYFANCAWDALGIPVAIQADAEIEAACAQSGEPIHLTIRGRQIRGQEALVHFLVPFREWYDDLTFT